MSGKSSVTFQFWVQPSKNFPVWRKNVVANPGIMDSWLQDESAGDVDSFTNLFMPAGDADSFTGLFFMPAVDADSYKKIHTSQRC